MRVGVKTLCNAFAPRSQPIQNNVLITEKYFSGDLKESICINLWSNVVSAGAFNFSYIVLPNIQFNLFNLFFSAKQCENVGEIFTECGSSCAQTCRDLSSDIQCNEECVPGCQCPNGQVLNDAKRCVPKAECPCPFEGKVVQPGDNVDVGNCVTW